MEHKFLVRVSLTEESDAKSTALSQPEREVLEILRRRGGDAWALELLNICKGSASPSTLRALEKKGAIAIRRAI